MIASASPRPPQCQEHSRILFLINRKLKILVCTYALLPSSVSSLGCILLQVVLRLGNSNRTINVHMHAYTLQMFSGIQLSRSAALCYWNFFGESNSNWKMRLLPSFHLHQHTMSAKQPHAILEVFSSCFLQCWCHWSYWVHQFGLELAICLICSSWCLCHAPPILSMLHITTELGIAEKLLKLL